MPTQYSAGNLEMETEEASPLAQRPVDLQLKQGFDNTPSTVPGQPLSEVLDPPPPHTQPATPSELAVAHMASSEGNSATVPLTLRPASIQPATERAIDEELEAARRASAGKVDGLIDAIPSTIGVPLTLASGDNSGQLDQKGTVAVSVQPENISLEPPKVEQAQSDETQDDLREEVNDLRKKVTELATLVERNTSAESSPETVRRPSPPNQLPVNLTRLIREKLFPMLKSPFALMLPVIAAFAYLLPYFNHRQVSADQANIVNHFNDSLAHFGEKTQNLLEEIKIAADLNTCPQDDRFKISNDKLVVAGQIDLAYHPFSLSNTSSFNNPVYSQEILAVYSVDILHDEQKKLDDFYFLSNGNGEESFLFSNDNSSPLRCEIFKNAVCDITHAIVKIEKNIQGQAQTIVIIPLVRKTDGVKSQETALSTPFYSMAPIRVEDPARVKKYAEAVTALSNAWKKAKGECKDNMPQPSTQSVIQKTQKGVVFYTATDKDKKKHQCMGGIVNSRTFISTPSCININSQWTDPESVKQVEDGKNLWVFQIGYPKWAVVCNWQENICAMSFARPIFQENEKIDTINAYPEWKGLFFAPPMNKGEKAYDCVLGKRHREGNGWFSFEFGCNFDQNAVSAPIFNNEGELVSFIAFSNEKNHLFGGNLVKKETISGLIKDTQELADKYNPKNF